MKYINIIAFSGVLYVNYLANALPINGMTTGAISDLYPSLFTPAGITFSIWGIIYLLLLSFVIFAVFRNYTNHESINPLFLLSCICNMSWIFAWHYLQTGLSVLIMIVFLITLTSIYRQLPGREAKSKEFWLVRVPFSVYLGWICIATVANISAYLIDLGINPPQAPVITAIMIGVLMVVVYLVQQRERNWAYSLTVIWALGGIILARLNDDHLMIAVVAGAAVIITLISTLRGGVAAKAG